MNFLDRKLQDYRIWYAQKWIPDGATILDAGCAQGAPALRKIETRIQRGVGIDPHLKTDETTGKIKLVCGNFPEDLQTVSEFSIILLLATFEHFDPEHQRKTAQASFDLLVPGGRVILTIPSPFVDLILRLGVRLKLLHGMDVEGHHGFVPKKAIAIFESAGFRKIAWKRFQLGFNNLFVFERP